MKLIIYFLRYLLHDILCYLGIHEWTICRIVDDKGRLTNYHRLCDHCDKEQELTRPKDYDPVAYVWTDINK